MPRFPRTRGGTGHSCRWCLTVYAIALIVGTDVRAQTRTLFNTDQVPRDLVVALLADDGGTLPDILIGKAPDLLAPKLVIPQGSRVLGTRLSSYQTTVVVDVPMRADSLRLELDGVLVRQGWRPAPPIQTGGGFQPASMRTPSAYCAGGQTLRFALLPQGRSTLLRYIVTEDEGRCATASTRTSSSYAAYSMPSLF